MTKTSEDKAPRRLSGRHVLASMLGFFAVIVAADATMIYSAVTTFGGVDNVNAYRDGLAYNARIARADKQVLLGWSDTVEVLRRPDRVRVAVRDGGGRAVPGLRVEVTVGRPATINADTTLKLAEVDPGVFEAPLGKEIGAGAWVATVEAFKGDQAEGDPTYQTRRRLWLAP